SPTPTPTQDDVLRLYALPNPVRQDEPVKVVIDVFSRASTSRAQIDFGDDSLKSVPLTGVAPLQIRYSISHSYSIPGIYRVSASIQGGRTASIAVEVTHSESGLGTIPNLIGKPEAEVRRMFN